MVYLRSLDDQLHIEIENGQNLLLGRIPECDVVLEDSSVSSQHARLKLKKGMLQVADLGSTNGTRLNYAQLEGPAFVLHGDTVEFGNVTFTVEGRGLLAPSSPTTDAKAMTSLEPIEASRPVDKTMRIQDVDAEADSEEDDRDPPAPPPPPPSPRPPPEVGNPERLAFGIALAVMLVAAGLVLLWISRIALPS